MESTTISNNSQFEIPEQRLKGMLPKHTAFKATTLAISGLVLSGVGTLCLQAVTEHPVEAQAQLTNFLTTYVQPIITQVGNILK